VNTTVTEEKITLLSKKGMKELKKEILQLEGDRRKALQALRELDKTLGHDERFDRIETLADLDVIESKIEDKKSVLHCAKLLPKKRTHLQVAIGSVVDLIDRHGHFRRFTIVNSVEADPSDGRISTLSPLGKNLIGKTTKDTIKWGNGRKANYWRLVRIT